MYMHGKFWRKHEVNYSSYFAYEVHILEFSEIVFLENKISVVWECNFISHYICNK